MPMHPPITPTSRPCPGLARGPNWGGSTVLIENPKRKQTFQPRATHPALGAPVQNRVAPIRLNRLACSSCVPPIRPSAAGPWTRVPPIQPRAPAQAESRVSPIQPALPAQSSVPPVPQILLLGEQTGIPKETTLVWSPSTGLGCWVESLYGYKRK